MANSQKLKIIKNIPFKYLDVNWVIKYVDEIPSNKDNFFFGQTHYDKREIWIATKLNGSPIPLITQSRTLYHELVHVILSEGQYDTESANEPLVEWIGKSLYNLIQNRDLFK